MRIFIGTLVMIIVAGCAGPLSWVPGGRLPGPEARLDLGAIPAAAAALQLETNDGKPYSVNIGFRRIGGQIYIDPTAERRWYQKIRVNPNVRIRFAGEEVVHPAVAVVETDTEVLRQFAADRIVIQLVPRE